MEGAHCFRPPQGCDETGLTLPVTEYGHDQGCTVIGGYVYRGSAQPALIGGIPVRRLLLRHGSGRSIRPATRSATRPSSPDGRAQLSSFGEDEAGELYVTDLSGGRLLKVSASRG